MDKFIYLQLPAGAQLPSLNFNGPFKAIICIEDDVTPDWRAKVSDWIVKAGCLYAMSWGRSCSAWDDSIDTANLEAFNWHKTPDHAHVVTTWHDDEPLSEVIWFSIHAARHATAEISKTLFLHIGQKTSKAEIDNMWNEVINDSS
ncbi:MAG: hypothetical protein P8H62_08355 [Henriciella sp.]|nr:hypothetical protein [Henriciella sp.]